MGDAPAPLRRLAEVSDYRGLLDAIRSRVAELDVTAAGLDDLCGLPDSYCGKLLCGAKVMQRVSLGCLLTALGLKIVIYVDDEAFAPMRHRLERSRFNRWGAASVRSNRKAPPAEMRLYTANLIPPAKRPKRGQPARERTAA